MVRSRLIDLEAVKRSGRPVVDDFLGNLPVGAVYRVNTEPFLKVDQSTYVSAGRPGQPWPEVRRVSSDDLADEITYQARVLDGIGVGYADTIGIRDLTREEQWRLTTEDSAAATVLAPYTPPPRTPTSRLASSPWSAGTVNS